jgi:DNA polymerase-3 subunit alpha
MEDFCARNDTRKLNKKAMECLVKCGAFDWTGEQRSQLNVEIDGALSAAASASRDRAAGQESLFDIFETAPKASKKQATMVAPWTAAEQLAFEKELLGFYVTGHPLDDYRPVLEGGGFVGIANLSDQEDKAVVTVGGTLAVVEKKFTKKDGKPFAVVQLEDLTGAIEILVWGDVFAKYGQQLVQGGAVSILGRVDKREETARMVANEVKQLKKPQPKEKPVILGFRCGSSTEADLLAVREILWKNPGNRRVELRFAVDDRREVRLVPATEFGVAWSGELQEKLGPWIRG